MTPQRVRKGRVPCYEVFVPRWPNGPEAAYLGKIRRVAPCLRSRGFKSLMFANGLKAKNAILGIP
jgi:hypothetical protein